MFPGSPLYRASNWVAESSTISSVPKDAVYIHLRINKCHRVKIAEKEKRTVTRSATNIKSGQRKSGKYCEKCEKPKKIYILQV